MDVEIVGRGEGERVSDKVVIKAGREEVVVTESLYPPGVSGPGPHIHREHADSFWVLDGEITFAVGPDLDTHKAGPGNFVLAPPRMVHTFRNEGPAEARFLNIHAPGKGFDEYMRSVRDGREYSWDSFDPPEDGGRSGSDALLLGPDGGEASASGPASIVRKVGREQDPGGLSLALSTIPPGYEGELPHVPERIVDSVYVLDGTLTLRGAGGETELDAGTYALVPPGTAHGLANRGDQPLRLLNIVPLALP